MCVCMCVCVCAVACVVRGVCVDQVYIGGRFTWLRQLCGLDSYLAQVLICLIQILFAIVAIRENLWVHIQCICRFACFSCDGRIHGTLYMVCVSVCVCVPLGAVVCAAISNR